MLHTQHVWSQCKRKLFLPCTVGLFYTRTAGPKGCPWQLLVLQHCENDPSGLCLQCCPRCPTMGPLPAGTEALTKTPGQWEVTGCGVCMCGSVFGVHFVDLWRVSPLWCMICGLLRGTVRRASILVLVPKC